MELDVIQLEERVQGWVIINIGHPNGGRKSIVTYTFSRTRKEAISKFTGGLSETWVYWRKKYNFRCVKAESTIDVYHEEITK